MEWFYLFPEKQDPCPERFRRIGEICYYVSEKQVNWKSASSMCRGLNSALLEFESPHEKRALLDALKDPAYQGEQRSAQRVLAEITQTISF